MNDKKLTRGEVVVGALGTALTGDTEQPRFADLLPADQFDSPLSTEIRQRIIDAAMRGERILPVLEQLQTAAQHNAIHIDALREYVLDIAIHYGRGQRLNDQERMVIVDIVRRWPGDQESRISLVDELEVQAPTIADAVAAQEVATTTKR